MKKTILTTFLMLLSFIAHADADADFSEATTAVNVDPKRAFDIGKSLDQRGDCRGNFILAMLYQYGEFAKGNPLKEDLSKTRELLIKSATAGCGISADLIARFYASAGGGIGFPRDLNKAIYWHGKAFESNNKTYCESAAIISEIYNDAQNYTEAYNWYSKAKNSGSAYCGPKERFAKLQELEVKQQKQAEVMREDPPVAGIRLSLSSVNDSPAKPKKKSKKKS